MEIGLICFLKRQDKRTRRLSDALPVQLGIETEVNLGWFKDHTPEQLWNGRDLDIASTLHMIIN